MNKDEELYQLSIQIGRDYEEHGDSEEVLRQCQEQQEWYDMCNETHRRMIDRWKRELS